MVMDPFLAQDLDAFLPNDLSLFEGIQYFKREIHYKNWFNENEKGLTITYFSSTSSAEGSCCLAKLFAWIALTKKSEN